MSDYPRFHLAFPVHDLNAARGFYKDMLGCREGRSNEHWVDFDFYGHQIVAHLSNEVETAAHNPVDGDQVPVRHFGVILPWDEWHVLAKKLEGKVEFIIKPHVRFKNAAGEQATMFFLDPSGNALEFKAFQDETKIFAVA